MGDVYGNATYGIILSSAKNGSNEPDTISSGTYTIYLRAKEISLEFDSAIKITENQGGTSYSNRNGKYSDGVGISDALIEGYGSGDTSTYMKMFNTIYKRMRLITYMGQPPWYLWIKNISVNEWYYPYTIGTTSYKYVPGYLTSIRTKIKGVPIFTSLRWKACQT